MQPLENFDQPQALACRTRYGGGVHVVAGLSVALMAIALPGCLDSGATQPAHTSKDAIHGDGIGPGPASTRGAGLGHQESAPSNRHPVEVFHPISPISESMPEQRAHQKASHGKQGVSDNTPYCFMNVCVDHTWFLAILNLAPPLMLGFWFGVAGGPNKRTADAMGIVGLILLIYIGWKGLNP